MQQLTEAGKPCPGQGVDCRGEDTQGLSISERGCASRVGEALDAELGNSKPKVALRSEGEDAVFCGRSPSWLRTLPLTPYQEPNLMAPSPPCPHSRDPRAGGVGGSPSKKVGMEGGGVLRVCSSG